MAKKYNEFYRIIKDILKLDEFKKLKNYNHHEGNRYDHCLSVAYYTYLVTKKLHLNYKEATRAALLHDFFTDEVKDLGSFSRLNKHPNVALENASKYFELTKLQKDIISKHMFPFTFIPPKYIESWLVNIIDNLVAISEKGYIKKKQLSAASTFLFLLGLSYLRVYLYN